MTSIPVQFLSEKVSGLIRATSIFPSIHCIVEELILNSIDADARTIQIIIDTEGFMVEIRDDGNGILPNVLHNYVGEYSATTKAMNSVSSYGFRGEALNLIRYIADLDIVSHSGDFCETYHKSFRNGVCINYAETANIFTGSGTLVSVSKIFENVGLRKKHTRFFMEINKIKDFICKMSILHHRIAWTLYDKTEEKNVLTLQQERSVASRFLCLHSPDILSMMTAINLTFGQMSISGMISPPLPSCCHWTKEYQYLFVNNRWTRRTDFITSAIDFAYASLLIGKSGGGPLPKHHAPQGPQTQMHPCFVLQFSCRSEAIDILSEPDKSVIIFADLAAVRNCVNSLLKTLFAQFNPEMLEDLEALFQGGLSRVVGLGSAANSTEATDPEMVTSVVNPEQVRQHTRATNQDKKPSGNRSISDVNYSDSTAMYQIRSCEERITASSTYASINVGRYDTVDSCSADETKIQESSESSMALSPLFECAFLAGCTAAHKQGAAAVYSAPDGNISNSNSDSNRYKGGLNGSSSAEATAGLENHRHTLKFDDLECVDGHSSEVHESHLSVCSDVGEGAQLISFPSGLIGRSDMTVTGTTKGKEIGVGLDVGLLDRAGMDKGVRVGVTRRDKGFTAEDFFDCQILTEDGQDQEFDGDADDHIVSRYNERSHFSSTSAAASRHGDDLMLKSRDDPYRHFEADALQQVSSRYDSRFDQISAADEVRHSDQDGSWVDPGSAEVQHADQGGYWVDPSVVEYRAGDEDWGQPAYGADEYTYEHADDDDNAADAFAARDDESPHSFHSAHSTEQSSQRYDPRHPVVVFSQNRCDRQSLALDWQKENASVLAATSRHLEFEADSTSLEAQSLGELKLLPEGAGLKEMTSTGKLHEGEKEEDRSASVIGSADEEMQGAPRALPQHLSSLQASNIFSRFAANKLATPLLSAASSAAFETTFFEDDGILSAVQQSKGRNDCKNAVPGSDEDSVTSLGTSSTARPVKALHQSMTAAASSQKIGGQGGPKQNVQVPKVETTTTMTMPCVSPVAGASSDTTAQSMSRLSPRISESPAVICKSALAGMRTLGQVDNKYILAITADGLLLAFDQHAVDERVRLEQFENDSCSCKSMCMACFDPSNKQSLHPTVQMELERSRVEILEAFTECFTKWGFDFELTSSDGKSVTSVGDFSNGPSSKGPSSTAGAAAASAAECRGFSSTQLVLKSVPVILGEPLTAADFSEFLHWVKKMCMESNLPVSMAKPPAVARIFASRACRTAIRFGDPLSAVQSEQLMARLATARLPFQCAHGRPSLSPLVDLGAIASRKKLQEGKRRGPPAVRLQSLNRAKLAKLSDRESESTGFQLNYSNVF